MGLVAAAVVLIGLIGAAVAAKSLRAHDINRKVQQVRADMRTLATALESYLVDHMIYPPYGIGRCGEGNVRSYNDTIVEKTGNRSGVGDLPTFLMNDFSQPGGRFDTLLATTLSLDWHPPRRLPREGQTVRHSEGRKWVSYIPSYPTDPFCRDRGATFVFWSLFPGATAPTGERHMKGVGWILVSPGPDGDYDIPVNYEAYDPSTSQPSAHLLGDTNSKGSAFTYDPTNGLISDGDIYRVKS